MKLSRLVSSQRNEEQAAIPDKAEMYAQASMDSRTCEADEHSIWH